jgi:hypothetical protein
MAWAIVNRAEDGRHVKSYTTQAMASQAMRDLVGRREGLSGAIPDNTTVTDDWGRRVTITQMKKGMTGKVYAALLEAYDARETGEITEAQTALLAKWSE